MAYRYDQANELRDVNVSRTCAKPQRELNLLALYSRNDRTNDFTNSIPNASTREVLSHWHNPNRPISPKVPIDQKNY